MALCICLAYSSYVSLPPRVLVIPSDLWAHPLYSPRERSPISLDGSWSGTGKRAGIRLAWVGVLGVVCLVGFKEYYGQPKARTWRHVAPIRPDLEVVGADMWRAEWSTPPSLWIIHAIQTARLCCTLGGRAIPQSAQEALAEHFT